MENNNQNHQPAAQPRPAYQFPPQQKKVWRVFPTGKKELIFAAATLIISLLLWNVFLTGGLNLGYALASAAMILCPVIYLKVSGRTMSGYGGALLGLMLVICAGFARSDDVLVKLALAAMLMLTQNLLLVLAAGQNIFRAGGFLSLVEPFRGAVMFGFGEVVPASLGLGKTLKEGGPAVKKTGAVLLGLALALPLLGILIPLLMSADAAFSGVVGLLPDFDLFELILTAFFGIPLAVFAYIRGTGLNYRPKKQEVKADCGVLSSLTVNTVLGAAAIVYAVYLLSQLAYFVGGFSGILPEGFTLAEYARRGFFEMAALCFVDLFVISLAVGLVRRKEGKAPLFTRLLCLFIGAMTLFLVITASAKMGMYISSYGLTRLRVLTEVVMVFMGLATALVCLWLFAPKLPYMKVILLLALSLGAVTLWADVDTVVAAYNVTAYQNGTLKTVDVEYLSRLGDGAQPFIARLVNDKDPAVSEQAKAALMGRVSSEDIRGWNFVDWYTEQAQFWLSDTE